MEHSVLFVPVVCCVRFLVAVLACLGYLCSRARQCVCGCKFVQCGCCGCARACVSPAYTCVFVACVGESSRAAAWAPETMWTSNFRSFCRTRSTAAASGLRASARAKRARREGGSSEGPSGCSPERGRRRPQTGGHDLPHAPEGPGEKSAG